MQRSDFPPFRGKRLARVHCRFLFSLVYCFPTARVSVARKWRCNVFFTCFFVDVHIRQLPSCARTIVVCELCAILGYLPQTRATTIHMSTRHAPGSEPVICRLSVESACLVPASCQ
jgi:hypothetical protein